MGGCESCASSRRKEVALLLSDSMKNGNISDLRAAIKEAEKEGIDSIPARQQYSELARQEWQAPERVQEMLRWAMSTQDGVILHNVIQGVTPIASEHAQEDLKAARVRLAEHQEEAKIRLQRLARNRDTRSMAVVLDRARHMGIPTEELDWADKSLKTIEESHAVRRDMGITPRSLATGASARTVY